MNFDYMLTEQQLMTRQLARDFADKEVAPFAKEWDQKNEYPRQTLEKMGEHNFFGLIFPPEYGGIGAGYLAWLLVIEEIARVSAQIASIMGQRSYVGEALYRFGSEYLKKTYLTPLAEGKRVVTFAFSEPQTGLFPQGLKTTAVRDGDEYVINGHKRFASFSPICDFAVIFCKTTDNRLGLFLVEREKVGKGWTNDRLEQFMGRGGTVSADLILENVRIPKENLVGDENSGYPILLDVVARVESPAIAADSVGLIQAALDEAIKYATTRIQPWAGNKPIAAYQAIQMRIGDIAIDLAAARSLVYNVGQLIDMGKAPRMEAAQAKAFAVLAAKRAIENSLHVHGAYGYTKDFLVERLYREQKMGELAGGSLDMQKMIIAGSLLNA